MLNNLFTVYIKGGMEYNLAETSKSKINLDYYEVYIYIYNFCV